MMKMHPDDGLMIEHDGQTLVIDSWLDRVVLHKYWQSTRWHVICFPGSMPAPHVSPLRDDQTEDLDHADPDGVPHDVVGLSALFSVLFAAVVLGMWLSGPTGRIAAVAICMVGVPMMVSNLRQRSERERNQHHPSR
jgi:hypothetical protein